MTIEELVVGDSRLTGKIIEAVTEFTIDLTSKGASQIKLGIVDWDFSILSTGLFRRRTPMTYGDLKMEIAVVETGDSPSPRGIQIIGRSSGVQAFKRNKTTVVRRNLSPSDFLRIEAGLVGATVVAQPSPKRSSISRKSTDSQFESTWDVMSKLANELGYLFFEANNVFYFGQPTWFVTRTDATKHQIAFTMTETEENVRFPVFGTPECRMSEDDLRAATVTLMLDRTNATTIRPGDLVEFSGVPTFEGDYIVSAVGWSVLKPGEPVSVSLETPIDPEVTDKKKSRKKVDPTVPQPPTPGIDQPPALVVWTQAGKA